MRKGATTRERPVGTDTITHTLLGVAVPSGTCMATLVKPARSTGFTRRGVLLVPPFGIEHAGSDRFLRMLADYAARLGHVVLTIEPVGTGDSTDLPEDVDLVRSYHEAIGAGVRVLVGLGTSVVVVGMRFGALVAAAALAEPDLRRLVGAAVLIEPITRGKNYRRELLLLGASTSAGLPDNWAAPAGSRLRPSDLAAMNALDINGLPSSADHVLIVHGPNAPFPVSTSVAWSSHASIEMLPQPIGELVIEDPELGHVMPRLISGIGDWIDRLPPPRTAETFGVEPPKGPPQDKARVYGEDQAFVARTHNAAPALTNRKAEDAATDVWDRQKRRIYSAADPKGFAAAGPSWREEAVALPMADGEMLHGIRTVPDRTTRVGLVLLSTGTNPRFGPARLHTILARRLAGQGVATLRMERRGAGVDGRTLDAYDPTHIDDARIIDAAAGALLGTPTTVLAGMCSGAWAAWHAMLGGLRSADVVLMNQIIFGPDSWDLSEGSPAIAVKTRHSLGDPERWRAILRGEIHVARSARNLVRYAALTARHRFGTGFSDLRDDLETISRRGTRVHFLFDSDESGLVYVRMHGSARLRELIDEGRITVSTVDDAGHVFSSPASVEWLCAAMVHRLTPEQPEAEPSSP